MGNLQTSELDNSLLALHNAPGWITTRYLAGSLATFSVFSSDPLSYPPLA